MIIWDETEAQNISKHQLNFKIVQNIKLKYQDMRFHLSTMLKIYTFFISFMTLLPSSIMPNSVSNYFLDGIDKYRCEMSDVAIIIGILNKIIFLLFAIYSSIKLRQISARYYTSNIIALFIIIPICTLLHIFAICNENWLVILSLDNSRKCGFICIVIFSISMICNHIMMQAQAKQNIVSGVRRVSTLMVQAAETARKSIRNSSILNTFKKNKIEVETIIEASRESSSAASILQNKNRFSIPEITEDEYDAIMIKSESGKDQDVDEIEMEQNEDENSELLQDDKEEIVEDTLLIEQNANNNEEIDIIENDHNENENINDNDRIKKENNDNDEVDNNDEEEEIEEHLNSEELLIKQIQDLKEEVNEEDNVKPVLKQEPES